MQYEVYGLFIAGIPAIFNFLRWVVFFLFMAWVASKLAKDQDSVAMDKITAAISAFRGDGLLDKISRLLGRGG